MKDIFLKKLENKKAKIGIIGMGYVGLPLALSFSEKDFEVTGFDIDSKKISLLSNGESYLKEFPAERINKSVMKGKLLATDDFEEIKKMDAVIICVPTPLGIHNEPDISFITNTMNSILPYLKKGQLISLESTTYPGTTDEEIIKKIEEMGFIIGTDIFVVFSPEREDPGNKNFNTQTTPKVIGGATYSCREIGCALYGSVIEKVIPVSSTKTAEMTKLLENIFRAVNIGLVNELKIALDKMGIDIWEVIDAASTKPFGFMPFYPGPGLGGHCIPIDPFYLTWKAREFGVHTRFIELAGQINTSMPHWIIEKVQEGLNHFKKSINGSKILVLGMSYKKNIDDLRESPSIEIVELLLRKGAIVDFSDPYIAKLPKMRNHNLDMKSVDLSANSIKYYDCVVISTDHDVYNYDMIQENAQLIVDSRGRYRKSFLNVIKA